MTFILKDFETIAAEQIEYLRSSTDRVTDFNVGSVSRTLLEAASIEIDDLYQAMYYGLIEAIPAAIYQAFEFPRLAAGYTTGTVRFTLDTISGTDRQIPAGTLVRVPGAGVGYLTQNALIIPPGELSGDVAVIATLAGSLGNTLAETITEISGGLFGVSVTNPLAFSNGRDAETELLRKQRFADYIGSLSRGTLEAIRYAARLATILDSQGGVSEYVASVGISETIPGQVRVYLSNGSATTSDALVARAQQIIDGYVTPTGTKISGYRAAGVEVVVSKVTPLTVPFTATVTPSTGYTLDAALRAAVVQAFDRALASATPGAPFFISAIIAEIAAVPGVAGINLVQPSANLAPGVDQILLRGVTTLS